jgi:hypothetical protein
MKQMPIKRCWTLDGVLEIQRHGLILPVLSTINACDCLHRTSSRSTPNDQRTGIRLTTPLSTMWHNLPSLPQFYLPGIIIRQDAHDRVERTIMDL